MYGSQCILSRDHIPFFFRLNLLDFEESLEANVNITTIISNAEKGPLNN